MVCESLRERELLFRVAPHLVKPVRLCTELAVAAAAAGAQIYIHSKVTGLLQEGGKVVGALATRANGDKLELRADLTINAGGPWVDKGLGAEKPEQAVESKRLIGGSKGATSSSTHSRAHQPTWSITSLRPTAA